MPARQSSIVDEAGHHLTPAKATAHLLRRTAVWSGACQQKSAPTVRQGTPKRNNRRPTLLPTEVAKSRQSTRTLQRHQTGPSRPTEGTKECRAGPWWIYRIALATRRPLARKSWRSPSSGLTFPQLYNCQVLLTVWHDIFGPPVQQNVAKRTQQASCRRTYTARPVPRCAGMGTFATARAGGAETPP